MYFGLRNAAKTFQRFIDQVLQGLHFTYVYIDDALIASYFHEEHLQNLRTVFHLFQQHGIVINPAKCKFRVEQQQYLLNLHSLLEVLDWITFILIKLDHYLLPMIINIDSLVLTGSHTGKRPCL